ncbi:MAG TPA: hypothetical protein VFP45_03485 [Candidatus Nitrosotalea sp.]|nr:hypothetical protein [Candidatus Nitrosotalea sp.]
MPKQMKLTRDEIYDAAYAIQQDVKRMGRCCTKLNKDIATIEKRSVKADQVYRLSVNEFTNWKTDHEDVIYFKQKRDDYLIRISRNKRLIEKLLDFAKRDESVSDEEEEDYTDETQETQVITPADDPSDEIDF